MAGQGMRRVVVVVGALLATGVLAAGAAGEHSVLELVSSGPAGRAILLAAAASDGLAAIVAGGGVREHTDDRAERVAATVALTTPVAANATWVRTAGR
jgi:hypothetical protein